MNTARTFDIADEDAPLLDKISGMCIRTWDAFRLKGYVRMDIRVDRNNNPYLLEINANPCISENGGFYQATQRAGIPFQDVIRRIVDDAFKN
jgi:D-alanine-D-alanine ligase